MGHQQVKSSKWDNINRQYNSFYCEILQICKFYMIRYLLKCVIGFRLSKRDTEGSNPLWDCPGYRLQGIGKSNIHSRSAVQVDQRVRLWHRATAFNLPWLLWRGQVLPRLPRPRGSQVFHLRLLLPWSLAWHCTHCFSSCGPSRWVTLHHQLLRA